MPGVRSSTILVLTALVLCIQAVSSQPDRDLEQNQDLDREVRRHRLLQRAHGAGLLSQVSHSQGFWWHTDTSLLKKNICAQTWTNSLRSSSHSLNWVTPLLLLDVFGPDVYWSAKSGHLTNQSHQFYADSLRFQRDQRCQEHWGVWRWAPLLTGRWTGLSRVGWKWPNLVMYLYVKVKGGIQHNTVPSCRIQMIWPRMSL